MNPEGIENCQKCNQKLNASYIEEVYHVDAQEQAPTTKTVVVNCEKCGRVYSTEMPSCPHCGFSNLKYQECNDVKTQSLDMNKTVAYGIGNYSATKASPFAVQDKSELKKTMVAGANVADPLSSPMVHDKSELKKTMVAGASVADPLSSPMIHDKSELKKTMVAGASAADPLLSPMIHDKSELKKTMVAGANAPMSMPPYGVNEKSELKKTMIAGDLNFSQPAHNQDNKSENQKLLKTVCDEISNCNNNFKYDLQSLDHGTQEPVIMRILTSSDICLKKGDMIFIAGMRYSVI